MESSPQNSELHCPKCGAVLPENAKSCWLCFAPLNATDFLAAGATPATPLTTEAGSTNSTASLVMFATLICVVFGVLTIAPGLGITLGFIAFVAWVRTVVKVQKRSANRQVVTTTTKVLLFIQSVVLTFLILGLVLVACVVTLFIACIVMLGKAGGGHM
jgi:hypothetical protein